MSSSRATNSAKMKRASDFQHQKPPNNFSATSNQPVQRVQAPKMLISDAIALISLRLGKLENIFHAFEIDQQNQEQILNYDDVFEDIINRLKGIEDKHESSLTQLKTENVALKTEVSLLKDSLLKLHLSQRMHTIEENMQIITRDTTL